MTAIIGHSHINFHPLINTMTCGTTLDGLIWRFFRATGHEP